MLRFATDYWFGPGGLEPRLGPRFSPLAIQSLPSAGNDLAVSLLATQASHCRHFALFLVYMSIFCLRHCPRGKVQLVLTWLTFSLNIYEHKFINKAASTFSLRHAAAR